MKNFYFLVIGVILFSLYSNAQINQAKLTKPVKKCATAELEQKFIAAHPGAETISQFESWINQKIAQKKATTNGIATVTPQVTVPVVFHIIHDNEAVGTGRNISQAAIRQQVLQINKDYANLSNSPYAVSEDMGIRFALAQKDTNGNVLAEPGIDRIDRNTKAGWPAPPYTVGYASSADFLTNTLKPGTIWDPTRYLNIWVSEWEAGILGISTFPASSTLSGLNNSETNTTAGVSIGYETVGSVFAPALGDCTDAYGKGKTLTHELGHFFGLRHIWGDAACGNDYCGDTPVHFQNNSGEPVHPKPNSCGTADEMFENYMDYSDDIITNTFTANQGDRMEAVFANSPRRASLATSNVGFVFVTASNQIAFADCDGATTISEKSAMTTCPKYKDVSFELNVEDKATAATTVTVTTGGTAINGVDYQLLTPSLSFAAGDNFKPVTIRVFDDVVASGNKTIILSYSIGAGGGVTSGAQGQSLSVTITDDDFNAQVSQTGSVVTLLSQDFGSITGSNQVPVGWTVTNSGTATNKWVVNNTAGAYGFTDNAAHISNGNAAAVTAGTAADTYTKTITTDARFSTPVLDATGLKNITLSFDYVSRGESNADLGIVYYSINGGSNYTALQDPYANLSLFQNTSALTHYSTTLPPSVSGSANLRFMFRWINDNSTGTNPPFTIDNILVTGNYQTIETTLNTTVTQSVNASADSYLYGSLDSQLIARINNPSANIGCLTATVTNAGTGLQSINTSTATYQRSDKVIKLTPAVANTTASYQATLYYTTAELAAWGAIVPNLKLMKVQDGVSLSSTLNPANAVVVTPTVDDQRATKGYVSFTGNFTGFSQFLLVSPLTALPVLSFDFQARPNEKNISLLWSTSSEINNKGFVVERSTDGINFIEIGWVDGKGNSNVISNYTFIDNFVQPDVTYYYRLRQTDINNKAIVSSTRLAKIKGNGLQVSINPNPAKDLVKLFVSGATGLSDIELYNAEGRLVKSWNKMNLSSPSPLNISGLAQGMYIFRIRAGSQIKVKKLIIH